MRILKFYIRPILWAFFIAFLCGMPGKDIPNISWLDWISFDKWVHAFIFFILHFLLIKSKLNSSDSIKNFNKINAGFSLASILYGGLMEVFQATIFTDRSADISDFAANSFGVFISFLYFRNSFKEQIL